MLSSSDLRARLRDLPPDVLRSIVESAVAPVRDDAPAPDGSTLVRVPGPDGRVLSYRLSADDLRL